MSKRDPYANAPIESRPVAWTVTYRLNGEIARETTITSSEALIEIKMLDAAPFSPTWHRGGIQRDTNGRLTSIRTFSTHKRQAKEVIARRA